MTRKYSLMILRSFILFQLLSFSTTQNMVKTYYINSKGIYVKIKKEGEKIKVLFKENQMFYFSLKNDSIALIQEINNGKIKRIKEYKISPNFDTVYIKRNTILGEKKKLGVEKVLFQKFY
jgi:hypothetical protein